MQQFGRALLLALTLLVSLRGGPVPLDGELMAALNSVVSSYLQAPEAEMFEPVHDISPRKPFIFFHVPKAGGSSLRATIYKATLRAKLAAFIPCHGGVPCATYHFPRAVPLGRSVNKAVSITGYKNVSAVSVYAGHFTTAEVSEHQVGTIPVQDFYCMTNFRDPADRLLSNIYYAAERRGKWKDIKHKQCINDVDLSALKEMLDVAVETTYAFTFLSGYRVPIQREGIPAEEVIDVLNATLQHLRKCTPIILEEPMSFKLLSDRYPQLGEYQAFDPQQISNAGHATQSCDKPDAAHAVVLEESVQLERILYTAVRAKIRGRINDVGLTPGVLRQQEKKRKKL